MTAATSIVLDPFLPPALILAVLAPLALAAVAAIVRRARGGLWRLAFVLAVGAVAANPSVIEEQRAPLDDVAVIVADRSASQAIGDRTAQVDAAVASLRAQLDGENGLDVRVITAGTDTIEETHLFDAIDRAIADVPRHRLAGTVLVTDGQVHDVPDPASLGNIGPVHTLMTGERGSGDRRMVLIDPPAFGIVNRSVMVTVQVDDLPDTALPEWTTVRIRRDGAEVGVHQVWTGRPHEIAVPLDHGGATVIEAEVEPGPQELTLTNNRAAIVVNGVRDRLRVLLVSGEPHIGERTWRNILKSDPSVDLVHFTILRPPEGQDGTPINELSLIAFPVRELFEVQLGEFDLIIFDRYRRRGVLHQTYLANIADYVAGGGAFLEASGPQFAEIFSLYRTPLGQILPGEPTGDVIERGFLPTLTDLGRRHPVTADLTDAGPADAEPTWGRWFRQIAVDPTDGLSVMTGADNRPLLLLDRVGDGRVAQLTSDHIWLWSRGFEGGGPQAELLRRLAHWLMREPALEEEDLTADVTGNHVTVTRRTLAEDLPETVTVTSPGGDAEPLPLTPLRPGVARGTAVVDEVGIHRITDGELETLAVVGTLNPPEVSDVRATPALLAPVTEATGGGVFWVEDGMPSVRRVRPNRDAAGSDWLGLRANQAFQVTGTRDTPLLPAWLAVLLVLAPLIAAWRAEGR